MTYRGKIFNRLRKYIVFNYQHNIIRIIRM